MATVDDFTVVTWAATTAKAVALATESRRPKALAKLEAGALAPGRLQT